MWNSGVVVVGIYGKKVMSWEGDKNKGGLAESGIALFDGTGKL